MFICREFQGGPKKLHVHDTPGSLVDAQRNAANGWRIYPLDTCGLPTLPFQSGTGPTPTPTTFVQKTVIPRG